MITLCSQVQGFLRLVLLELKPQDDGGGAEPFLACSPEWSLRGRGPVQQRELKLVLSVCNSESCLEVGVMESRWCFKPEE